MKISLPNGYILIVEISKQYQHRKVKHMRVWNRKGNCPGCNVVQGSSHKKGCEHRIKLLTQGGKIP